jgi:tRNA A-37 threonylcarbamoyl transferase component Bud32
MRQIGLDADLVFSHPDIVPWRTLPDRENCTLDGTVDGRAVRLHIKRWRARCSGAAQDEVNGIQLLAAAGMETVPLVGWGHIADGRSFIITEDLAGYRDAEKLVAGGMPFEKLLQPTAQLAGKLHAAGLHHRDLYLCHFFAREDDPSELRLIDVARVKALPRLLSRRWIVKDLAQFIYSTMSLEISDEQRKRWLEEYEKAAGLRISPGAHRAIERKVRAIAGHDRKLKQTEPTRNISIPQPGPDR